MTKLVWDAPGTRLYETGLDQGVLYLEDGSAVPWNGLTSIDEEIDAEKQSVFFDGVKINELIRPGEFSATMKAITYPNEFLEFEGIVTQRQGVYYSNQPPKAFSISYRTNVGDDVHGDDHAYKIHVLYNLFAVPKLKTYATRSASPSVVEFEWELEAVPEEIDGVHATAHLVLDIREMDPYLVIALEEILYGSDEKDANLPSISDLATFLSEWYRLKIVDNEDGTWTAIESVPGFIRMLDVDLFEISDANTNYISPDEYEISDTEG